MKKLNKRSVTFVVLFTLALSLCLYAHPVVGVNLDRISLRPTADVPSSVAYNQTLVITLRGTKIYSDGSKQPLKNEPVTCHIKHPDGSEETIIQATTETGLVTFTIGPLASGQYQIWFDENYKRLATFYAKTEVFTVTWESAPTTPGFVPPTFGPLMIVVVVIIVIVVIVAILAKFLAKSEFLAKLRSREPLY